MPAHPPQSLARLIESRRPRGRDDFRGAWIGPTENAKADPLSAIGGWIAPPADMPDAAPGEAALSRTFELPDGYPRCFGMAWVAADPACGVVLNGEKLDTHGPLSLTGVDQFQLPWNLLRRGENTLEVTGPVEALGRGVACLARVHEAVTGWHTVVSDEAWRFGAGDEQGGIMLLKDSAAPPTPEDNGPRRSVELERTFDLPELPQAARVYVTGLGAYELTINGHRVGDELLAPGWTDYEQRMHYAVHDVTPLLKAGENRIVAVLGNGWWSSGMGWEGLGKSARPGQPLRLLLDLVTFDQDGSADTPVCSDERWRWRPSSVLRDTIYHGETVDLRAASRGQWRPAGVIDDGFSPRIEPMPCEPIRVTQTLRAQQITPLPSGDASGGTSGGGGWLFDFGQNHAGRPRLRAEVPAGTELILTHCEVLDENGQPYLENYRTASATDRVIAGDQPIDWAPSFTYRGYRYARLTGLPAGFEPTDDTLTSEVLHNDVQPASRFHCSNPRLNAIDRIARWGLRSNLHSVPTDCPQRDERLGWTGDVQLFAATSCWLFDLDTFYGKWLDDLFDAQREDGGVTHIAPYVPVLPPDSAPVWADVVTVLPTLLYRVYGDRNVLERAYEPMKRWVDWMDRRAEDGLALIEGFGDWVPVEQTPSAMCGTAYYAWSSRLVSRAASELGHEDDAQRYAVMADRAAEAFHRHYFDPKLGHYEPDTQTAQILPLAFDLTPPALRQRVANHLAAKLEANDDKLATGFIGTALLLPTLSRFGHHELAYRVLNTDRYPSLGYMIDQGATTVWERWNSDKEGPDMNSRNHFCFGSMAQWLYEELVGIKPDPQQPGFAGVKLRPRPVGDVESAEMSYQCPHGEIAVRWEVVDGELVYEAELPAGVTGELTLPVGDVGLIRAEGTAEHKPLEQAAGALRLSPGRHRFRCPLAQPAGDAVAG